MRVYYGRTASAIHERARRGRELHVSFLCSVSIVYICMYMTRESQYVNGTNAAGKCILIFSNIDYSITGTRLFSTSTILAS